MSFGYLENMCDGQIKKNEIGRACSVHGGREKVNTGFWWGNLRERDHLEEVSLDWRVILKRIFKKWGGVMDWIYLAQDRDMRRAVVNTVRNLRCSLNGENFLAG